MITAAQARKKANTLAEDKSSDVYKRRKELDELVAEEMKRIEGAIEYAIKEDEKSVHIRDARDYGITYIYGWMRRFEHNPPPTSSDNDYNDNLAIDALNIILKKLRAKGFKCESDFVNKSHMDQCLKISW